MDELAREIKTMRPGDPRRAQIVQEIIRLTITCIKPATERYFRLGVLPLRLIFLFATPTDLLAESCFSQETLIFHGVVRLVVVLADSFQYKSLVRLFAAYQFQNRCYLNDLGRPVGQIAVMPVVTIAFGPTGQWLAPH